MFHIGKMRRYSEFSHIIHFIRPDLDFRRKTEHPEHGCVDALVAIEFRYGDIVFDFFDERRIVFMDDTKHHITVAYRFGDHSIRKQIHNGADLCRLVSFLEFFKHSIRTLDPSFDLEILDSFFLQETRQRFDASLRIFFSFTEIFFQISENIIKRFLF